jgi:hypothetical protein
VIDKNKVDYEAEIWRRAVQDAESEVMRFTATPSGGKTPTESTERYVARVRGYQDAALEKLAHARGQLAERSKP